MFILIENGEVYSPEPLGRASVLLVNDRILHVGELDRSALEALPLEVEVVDASGCLVLPGLIDPHQHLLGGSGEKGFSYQTPEIHATEIVRGGITTVVGCLGVDTTMKTMPGLLAKVKALTEEGLTAFLWTGGYNVPPSSIMKSVRDDIMFIAEVIGVGEVAISDHRSTEPRDDELARLISDAHVGGMLSQKAGVTHIHVGRGEERLTPVLRVLDRYQLPPECVYLTHVERSEALMDEAIALAGRGAFVDIDTVGEDLDKWLRYYVGHGGDLRQLTISSDASITSPRNLPEQLFGLVRHHGWPLEQVLPLATSNTARVLRLEDKGRLEAGRCADVLVLQRDTLQLREVIARGNRLIKGGALAFRERFLGESNREVHLVGKNAPDR